LKTRYRDGTTHVIFESEDFIARLAALVPKPRAHLIRFHGVFAPSSTLRVIASIEEAEVISRILGHLGIEQGPADRRAPAPPGRGPPPGPR
jgi:hypothetical protein